MNLFSSEVLNTYPDRIAVNASLKVLKKEAGSPYAFQKEVRDMVTDVVGPLFEYEDMKYLLSVRNNIVFWEEIYVVIDQLYNDYPNLEIYFRRFILLSLDCRLDKRNWDTSFLLKNCLES